jgi:hypothetical protein
MSRLTSLVIVAILVVATGVAIGLLTTRSTRLVQTQESGLPAEFKVGVSMQQDFGSPIWRIEAIQGQWLKVTDVSPEPQYTGTYWINAVTGRAWAVK